MRTTQFNVRASREELERWTGEAQAAGLTLSKYVRRCLDAFEPLLPPEPEPEERWQVALQRLINS